jgi:multidrug transporter EmrE-like cation transporter
MLAAFTLLGLAIASEVAATSALPKTDGFTDWRWTVLVVAGYAFAIWMLAIVVKYIPVSTAYAVWAGLGTAIIAVVGATLLNESWDALKVMALLMIVFGVVVLNLRGAH